MKLKKIITILSFAVILTGCYANKKQHGMPRDDDSAYGNNVAYADTNSGMDDAHLNKNDNNSNKYLSSKAISKNCKKYLNQYNNQYMINFGFDRYWVEDKYNDCLNAVANYLKNNDDNVSLQGHTDETGSVSYNMSLGEKRANSVKNILLNKYNVPKDKVCTISYGKSMPISIPKSLKINDQEKHSMNRRVELVFGGCN